VDHEAGGHPEPTSRLAFSVLVLVGLVELVILLFLIWYAWR